MTAKRTTPLVIGALPSPFVRKVLAVLELKGLKYEIDPVIPFFGDDRFSQISPLRRIPVFIDDQVTLSDSSVICQYLEDRYPEPRAYPADIAARAHARWLEEFADTRMADVFIWRIFYPAAVRPAVFKAERDMPAIERAVREDVPEVMRYLETVAPRDGFVCGDISIADIALAVNVRNLRWARFQLPADVAPMAAAWMARVESHPALAHVTAIADACIRTAPGEQRALVQRMGLAVAGETFGASTPRRGPMTL